MNFLDEFIQYFLSTSGRDPIQTFNSWVRQKQNQELILSGEDALLCIQTAKNLQMEPIDYQQIFIGGIK